MKSVLKKAAALLTQTWLWSLLLVLSVALLVWWGGPLLAVNDHKFWADPVARLLSISVLILVWGLAMVFVSWRAGQHKKAMADSEEGQVLLLWVRRRPQETEFEIDIDVDDDEEDDGVDMRFVSSHRKLWTIEIFSTC